MSKVLVLANHYNTLRIFRRELLTKMVSDGNEVLVVIPECDSNNKRILESYGCKIQFVSMERRGMNPVKDITLFSTYLKLLRRFKPDKVITYTIKCNIYGAMACKIKIIPCYVNVTGLGSAFQGNGKTRKLVSFMYKHSLNKAEKIFFENKGNRDVLVQDGIVRKEQTVVMAGAGVNLKEFPLKPYPSEDEGINFLFVGRIMEEKGVDELFNAIKEIRKKYPKTTFKFIGWYEDDYKETVEQLQKEGYIQFYGFQPDVKPFLEEAHCIILPSWHEGMSNTLLEGAATGRPLITSRIHGCMEAVIEGENGFLVNVKDSGSIVEQMKKLLKLTREERERMGQAGRKYMEKKFDKDMVVKRTLDMIFEK